MNHQFYIFYFPELLFTLPIYSIWFIHLQPARPSQGPLFLVEKNNDGRQKGFRESLNDILFIKVGFIVKHDPASSLSADGLQELKTKSTQSVLVQDRNFFDYSIIYSIQTEYRTFLKVCPFLVLLIIFISGYNLSRSLTCLLFRDPGTFNHDRFFLFWHYHWSSLQIRCLYRTIVSMVEVWSNSSIVAPTTQWTSK